MKEYKFEIMHRADVPDKNGRTFSKEALEKMSKQVSERCKNGNPIPLMIKESNDYNTFENLTTLKPENRIGDVTVFSEDYINTMVKDDKYDIFNELIKNNYTPGYRIVARIDDDKVIAGDLKIISFDMIKDRA